nr:acyl carrier protein [Bacteriovorax sp. HI3]
MTHKILEKITPVVREVFENPAMVVTSDLNADNVADWDSVRHISLIVGIEDATGVAFTSDELANLHSIGDFVQLLTVKGYEA